ncbi:tRNA (guanosine(37)-N1)-methyltransferase TrmD [Selenomonas sputigena]|uniref:tRNA (guanine-N(1)-)-methyltransferase n=1 Tax=Selenomonas sputigena TaxID=69823 RepID=A0ABV3X1Y4_9FIRM
MRIDIVTLFPAMFEGVFGASIIKRAQEKGLLDIRFTQLRDFAFDKHRQVDDSPFGGGSGMVLKPEPMFRAVRSILAGSACARRRILLMCPSGRTFTQDMAKELAAEEQLIVLCGHYEGFDARIREHLVDETISVGDFVLTGGELPAMIVVDAVARMLPGVLGSEESAPTDSFYEGLLGFPQYTRPREYEGMTTPEVLLSGDHAKIRAWRRKESLRLTRKNRPELLQRAGLTAEDRRFLAELEAEDGWETH